MKQKLLFPLLLLTLSATAQKRDSLVVFRIDDFKKLNGIIQELQQPNLSDAVRLRIKLDLPVLYNKIAIVADTAVLFERKLRKQKGGN